MQSLFSPDSRFMAALGRAADLLILNLLYLLTCLPVFTAGAASCALYSVVFAMGTLREGSVLRAYFRAFRSCFRAATKVWLVLLFVFLAMYADFRLLPLLPEGWSYFSILLLILSFIALVTACYAFPLVCFFDNTLMGTLKSALILGIGNLPVSLVILVIQLLPVILLTVFPLVFFNAAFIWIAVYFSAGAYICSLLLRRVLQPYLPEDTFKQEDSQ